MSGNWRADADIAGGISSSSHEVEIRIDEKVSEAVPIGSERFEISLQREGRTTSASGSSFCAIEDGKGISRLLNGR